MTDDPLDASTCPPAPAGPSGTPARGLPAVLAADFAEHGAEAVEALRLERPHDYLKLVASLATKDTPVATPTIEDLTDDELMRVLNALRSRTSAGGSAPNANGA